MTDEQMTWKIAAERHLDALRAAAADLRRAKVEDPGAVRGEEPRVHRSFQDLGYLIGVLQRVAAD